MSPTTTQVLLVVPGLQGPESDHPIADYLERRPVTLDRLMTRAQAARQPGLGLHALLLNQFGQADDTAIAPLTYAVDAGHPATDVVLRADPVHLRPDQSCLRLFESHSFTLSQAEADALVDTFNTFYADQGWQLDAPVATRWYLHAPSAPAIHTVPPAGVAGQDIGPALPHGDTVRSWHAMLNEVQMLFHAHEVNLERERRGQPVINSLWPWGEGTAPVATRPPIDQVLGRDPLACGLAELAGIDRTDPPEEAGGLMERLSVGTTLLVDDALDWPARYNEVENWLERLFLLEQTLFAPLAELLASGRLSALQLLPCNGQRYSLTRRQLRVFWRRPRPFEQRLA